MGQAHLLKEPYKGIWVDTKYQAKDFKYVELIKKNTESVLTGKGYVMMDIIHCYNSLEECPSVFLGHINFLDDGKD